MVSSTASSFKKLYEKALLRQQQPGQNDDDETDHPQQAGSNASVIPHSMDYAGFKHMLRCMARRRARIRKLLRKEPDQKLPESVIQNELEEFLTPQTGKALDTSTDSSLPPQSIGGHPDEDSSSHPEELDSQDDQDESVWVMTPPRTPLVSNASTSTTTNRPVITTQKQPPQASPFQRSSSAPTRAGSNSFQHYMNVYEGTAELSPTNSQLQQQQQAQPQSAAGDVAVPSYYAPLGDDPQSQAAHTQDFENMLQDIHATETYSDSESIHSYSHPTTTTPPRSRQRSRRSLDQRRTKAAVLRKISARERYEMVSFLQHELHKVYMYYITTSQQLSTRIDQIQQRLQNNTDKTHEGYQAPSVATGNENDIEDHHTSLTGVISPQLLRPLVQDILSTMAFCTINTVTACQMLIRYDAYARTFEGTPMMEYYLKQGGHFRKLLQHAEIHALADNLTNIMIAMTSSSTETDPTAEMQSSSGLEPPVTTSSLSVLDQEETTATMALLHDLGQQRAFFQTLLHGIFADPSVAVIHPSPNNNNSHNNKKTPSSTPELSDASHFSRPGWLNTHIRRLRSWIEYGAYDVDRLGLEPAFLTMRGKSLTEEMRQLAKWSKKRSSSSSSLTTDDGQSLQQSKDEEQKLSGIQIFNLTLNLISAFLYCMNYYIVEPSSTLYVNRLGAHDALSGTLIGMMPLGAFLSSIPFSMWTNKSFRHPFIMSCTLMILGNVMYSLADRLRSVPMALMGRLIAGLGAPKCIIRRYMADTTPLSLRTSVNASFGMVVAAGSAMGPAMAVLLTRIELIAKLPVLGWMQFNGLTMPGYFMATLWTTFLLILLLTFDEPNRAGLEEQKRLEKEKTMVHKGGAFQQEVDDETVDAAEEDDDDDSVEDGSDHNDDDSMEEPIPRRLAPQKSMSNETPDYELRTIFTKDTFTQSSNHDDGTAQTSLSKELAQYRLSLQASMSGEGARVGFFRTWQIRLSNYMELITPPVRICLGLLFCKVFTIETLASATSVVSKNRYHWQVKQVGMLGFVNGCLVIPFSIIVGRLSMRFQDQKLMQALVGIGCCGFFLLIDLSDLVDPHSRGDYNEGHILAVGPYRYVTGYFLCYMSIQAFEGVIGSALSKVIPTALASGTLNSGLLATLTDTLGRSCGDLFISLVGFISLRQLMNLLFIPGFCIMLGCFVVIRQYRDLLAV